MGAASRRTCACGKKGGGNPENKKKTESQAPTCACGKRTKKQSKKKML